MNLDLQQWQLRRPEKIRWLYNRSAPNLYAAIKSPSLRAFLRHTDEYLAAYEITYDEKELTQASYKNWLKHYAKVMIEKNYDVIAKPEWLSKKWAEGKEVRGYFYYYQGELQGSLIYAKKGNERVYAAYKTSLKIPEISTKKHGSLGAMIDLIFLREMLDQQFPWISHGSMRNAFGVLNTYGNLRYKLDMGFQVIAEADTPWLNSVPLSQEKTVAFFGGSQESDSLTLYGYSKSGTGQPNWGSDTMEVTLLEQPNE